jgi:hypothetical protein
MEAFPSARTVGVGALLAAPSKTGTLCARSALHTYERSIPTQFGVH